ncbi:MAG: hypothetical protein ACE5D1_08760 [Fidelibacterota bacterium]
MLNNKFIRSLFLLLLVGFILPGMALKAQTTQYSQIQQKYRAQDFPRSGERYITDEYGVIRMWVNVWGWVNKPGSHLVYDGIDLATLLSVTGGPRTGANLKKIRVFRELPDENGKQTYVLNMEKFLKTGNRDDFIKVLPNDTYVIPQSTFSYIISQTGWISTVMNLINLYFLADYYRTRTK